MGKLSFLAGAAAGYVLGTKAGKQRYQQIKSGASRVWSSQPVQAKVGDVSETVKRQAAPFVADKLGDAAKAASRAMKQQTHRAHQPETTQHGPDGQLHDGPTGYGQGPGTLS